MVTKGDSILNKDTLIVGSIDTTIYALYTNQPKFTLDLDGGSVSKTYLTQYDSGSNIELESPRKKGTNFVRWEIVEGNGVLSGNTYTQGSENVVLKAIYESCPIGTYNDGNSSSCKACQDGLTTSEEGKSSCDVSCDNNSNVSSWNISTYDSSTNTVSGVCSINTCEPCYKKESNRCNAQTTLYVSSSGNDSNGGYETSIPFKTINKAYTCPGNLTIKLLSDITQTTQTNFNTLNKEVTLTSEEGTYTITRGSNVQNIFAISNGEFIVTNVNFNGNNITTNTPVLNMAGTSKLNLNNVKILSQNSPALYDFGKDLNIVNSEISSTSSDRAAIIINGATATINDTKVTSTNQAALYVENSGIINLINGEIINNSSSRASIISLDSTVTINGTKVTSTNQAALYVEDSGTANLTNVELINNASNRACVIIVGSKATMNSGKITSQKNSAIYIEASGNVNIKNGTIINYYKNYPTIDILNSGSKAVITGGTITNSGTSGSGSQYAVWKRDQATCSITGGSVGSNNC
jgi:hypothetical protein